MRAAALDASPDALLPGIAYQIAKLDLKPGNILVVKLTRDDLTDKQINQAQYELQKFVGRKVMVLKPGQDIAVIEGVKVPK